MELETYATVPTEDRRLNGEVTIRIGCGSSLVRARNDVRASERFLCFAVKHKSGCRMLAIQIYGESHNKHYAWKFFHEV